MDGSTAEAKMRSWGGCLGSGVPRLGLLFVSEVASPRGKEMMLSSFLLLPWGQKGLPREKKSGQYFVVCVCVLV